jgi:hypothetical protein
VARNSYGVNPRQVCPAAIFALRNDVPSEVRGLDRDHDEQSPCLLLTCVATVHRSVGFIDHDLDGRLT